MNAREYFETVRAAQRGIDRRLAVLASMRERETVRAQRYDAGPHGMGGENHSMEATVSRMDYESRAECEIADLRAEVDGGRSVCAGVRAANPTSRWGDMLELRYCEDWPTRRIATVLDVSERTVCGDIAAALDWVDSVGIARAREGMGQAALF